LAILSIAGLWGKMSKLKEMGAPAMWAEGHPGELRAQGWEVEVGGLVENPVTLNYGQIRELPKAVVDARLTSVSGFTVGGAWGGVRLSDVFSIVRPEPEASHVQFVSYRRIYTTSIPLEVARRERTLLAYAFEGEPLESDYGGPVRIFCPYLWGYKSAKSVIAINLVDRSIPGFWETRGYPESAQIKRRRIFDVNSGTWRRIPGGEVTEFVD
jgi:DMSO/TMAO reductase YedYZ molybdopterin-dependent catalytic subunit